MAYSQQNGQPGQKLFIQNSMAQTQGSTPSIPPISMVPPVIPPDTPCIDPITGDRKEPNVVVNYNSLSIGNMYGMIGSHNAMIVNNQHHYQYHDSDLSSDSDEDEEEEPYDPRVEELFESTRRITDSDLKMLSKNLGGFWKRMARHLGVSEEDIDYECARQDSGGTPKVVYQLLLMWKETSVDPSVSTMASALEECGLKRVLKKFIEKDSDS